MGENSRDYQSEYFHLMSLFANEAISLSDEEVREEACKRGLNLANYARNMKDQIIAALEEQQRELLRKRLDEARKQRLAAESNHPTSRSKRLSRTEMVSRLQKYDRMTSGALSAQFRNLKEISDDDLASLLDDYDALLGKNAKDTD